MCHGSFSGYLDVQSHAWLFESESVSMQAFMACGERADKGEIEMTECLKEVCPYLCMSAWHEALPAGQTGCLL